MKKITAILLAAIVLVACFAVVASANKSESAVIVKDTVLKATPKVDAKLDPAYLQSMQVKLNPPKYAGADTDVKATVYALYDDKFVYVFYAVENDTTLMTTDDDYINEHPHPSHNDAIELRIGDDLEEKLPPYDGSNAAHHLFMMDAYGKRYSCYEDAMGDYCELMEGKAEIVSDTAYNIEIKVPLADSFAEGDIIQFNFQIDDLQDDMDTTGYIGLGATYFTLVDFTIGGAADGSATVTPEEPKEDPKVEEPVVKPEEPKEDPKVEEPVVKPEEPKEDPKVEEPVVKPEEPKEDPKVEEPVVNPEDPAVDPEDPAVDPEDPAVDPEDPAVEPEDPAVDPEDPAVEPEDPAVEPEDPAVEPEDPAVEPEEPKDDKAGAPIGLIIGIVAAVVVIAAVVVALTKKKK